jgi:lipopolysaccharide export system protein LptA
VKVPGPPQPALGSHAKALVAGFAVVAALGFPGLVCAAAETAQVGPAPLVSGQPIPDVEPLKACPLQHDLCVESQEQGDYDVHAGVAELRGNVRGYMRSRDMAFASQRLKAMHGTEGSARRVELYGAVRMTEPGLKIASENAVLEDNVATLYGSVRVEQPGEWMEGDQVVVDHEAQRLTVTGKPGQPMTFLVADQTQEPEAKIPATGQTPAIPGSSPAVPSTSGDGTQAWAQRAVVEEDGRQLQLTGAVHVKVPARQIVMDAENVTLQFNDDGTVTGFTARGNVSISQPGRRLNSESARSQNRMQTILLLGKARMQQEGQFDLVSDRLEVFVDAKRGVVRSEDRQKPMSLSLDVSAVRGWRLDAARMTKLKDQGIPEAVLKKLEPLQGHSYPSQPAFEQAVGDRLSPEESERHLSTISNQARP